jgi:hypothetical protein
VTGQSHIALQHSQLSDRFKMMLAAGFTHDDADSRRQLSGWPVSAVLHGMAVMVTWGFGRRYACGGVGLRSASRSAAVAKVYRRTRKACDFGEFDHPLAPDGHDLPMPRTTLRAQT